eukprot:6559768-Pyramimonas_sp.AAC.1
MLTVALSALTVERAGRGWSADREADLERNVKNAWLLLIHFRGPRRANSILGLSLPPCAIALSPV